MINLDKRLAALASLVEGDVVADIGCDHGRLSVRLLQDNPARQVFAVDISAPSLQKAISLAAVCEVGDRLSAICGDGLAALPCTVDTAVIAGVGGKKIAEILSDSRRIDKTAKFVLQPMRNADKLLSWLTNEGYTITHNCVVEDRKKYVIIKCER